jgi:hypothetical protein
MGKLDYENHIITCISNYRRGLDWRLDLLTTLTRLMTTRNYIAITNLHNLQITTARAKSFQSAVSSPVVPWWRLLTLYVVQFPRWLYCRWLSTAPITSSLHRLPYNWPLSLLLASVITSRHGQRRKHRSLVYSNAFPWVNVYEGVTK